MSDVLKPLLGSLLRHMFTAGGVTAVVLSGDQIQTIIGAISTLVGIAWSVYRGVKQSAAPALAVAQAVQARAPQDPANL